MCYKRLFVFAPGVVGGRGVADMKKDSGLEIKNEIIELSGYVVWQWVFCLRCNFILWGVDKRAIAPQSTTKTCTKCEARNVFRDSIQPVEVTADSVREQSPSIYSEDILVRIPVHRGL